MKKILIAKLVVLCIVLALIIPIGIGLITGYGFRWGGNFGFFNFGTQEGFAELKVNDSFSNVESIKTKLIDENIIVYTHDKKTVDVKYYGDEKHTPVVKQNGNTLIIERKKEFSFFNFNWSWTASRVEIYVPKDALIEGNLNSVSGNIEVNATFNNEYLETVSGNISVYESGNKLTATSVSGNIRIYEPFDTVSFNTVSGNVRINTKEGSSLRGDTVSGDVRANLCDTNCGYSLIFSSVSGSFKDNYNNQKIDKKANISQGNSSISFDVETVSGDFKLEDWD